MPLPVVAVSLGTLVLRGIASRLGIGVAIQVFRTGGLAGVARFLLTRAVAAIAGFLTVNQLTSWFWQTVEFIWRFNWNISDEAIDQQINSALENLAGIAGGVLGGTLAYLACGTRMLIINPAALTFLDEITDEIIDEIVQNWTTLFRATVGTVAKIGFLKGYKSIRTWLKKSGVAAAVLGQENAEAWGKKGGGVVSFAKTWEEVVESIEPQWLENFAEEFFEEFYEGCKEVTFLIAGFADRAIALNRQGIKSKVLGEDVIVELQPNRDLSGEKTVIAGKAEIVKAQVVQVLAQNQLMSNRDVGIIIGGEPYQEVAKRRDPRNITCIFEFATNNQKPFFKPVGTTETGQATRIIRPRVTISNIKRSKLDWSTLKQVCGGINGYTYGRHKCSYQLSSTTGSDRGTISVYALTYEEAKDRCEAFLGLTDSILNYSIAGQDKEGGNRSTARDNMKPTVKIYPYRVTICVGVDSTNQQVGRKILTSATARSTLRKAVIDLWPNQEPANTQERISALFTLLS